MRKPIVLLPKCHLFLLASVRAHSPDLHVSRALGVEVNVLPVRRIIGTVIQSLGGGQPRLFSARCRNRIAVELAVSLTNERQCLPIRRPSMPVGRRLLRDPPRSSSRDRHTARKRVVALLRP